MFRDSSSDDEDGFPLIPQSISPPHPHSSLQHPSYSSPPFDPLAQTNQWERFRELEADVEMLKRALHSKVGDDSEGSATLPTDNNHKPPLSGAPTPTGMGNEVRSSVHGVHGPNQEPSNNGTLTMNSSPVEVAPSPSSTAPDAPKIPTSSLYLAQQRNSPQTKVPKAMKASFSLLTKQRANGKTADGFDEMKANPSEEKQEKVKGVRNNAESREKWANGRRIAPGGVEANEQNWREGHAEIELRNLVPHLSPLFSCSHTDCLLLLTAIRQGGGFAGGVGPRIHHGTGGGGGRSDLSLLDRLQIVEAEKRTLMQRLEKYETSHQVLLQEMANLKERVNLVKTEAKQSLTYIGQKRDEVKRQLLLEETRSEKLRVQNRKLEAELEQLKRRIRGNY